MFKQEEHLETFLFKSQLVRKVTQIMISRTVWDYNKWSNFHIMIIIRNIRGFFLLKNARKTVTFAKVSFVGIDWGLFKSWSLGMGRDWPQLMLKFLHLKLIGKKSCYYRERTKFIFFYLKPWSSGVGWCYNSCQFFS